MSCWQCYKVILEEEKDGKEYKIDEKRVFCGSDWYDKFMGINTVNICCESSVILIILGIMQ